MAGLSSLFLDHRQQVVSSVREGLQVNTLGSSSKDSFMLKIKQNSKRALTSPFLWAPPLLFCSVLFWSGLQSLRAILLWHASTFFVLLQHQNPSCPAPAGSPGSVWVSGEEIRLCSRITVG